MKKKASTEIRTQVKRVRVSSANRYTIEAYLIGKKEIKLRILNYFLKVFSYNKNYIIKILWLL